MAVTILKCMGQIFYRVFLSLGLSDIPSGLNSGGSLLAALDRSEVVIVPCMTSGGPRCRFVPSLVVLILITRLKWCLPGFHYKVIFPFIT